MSSTEPQTTNGEGGYRAGGGLRSRRTGFLNGRVIAAVGVLVALVVLLTWTDNDSRAGERLQTVTAAQAVGVGPFWYTRTVGTMRAPRCLKTRPGIFARCDGTAWFVVQMSSETWVGVDGTMRERNVEVSQRFASGADRARWVATGKPVPRPLSVAQGDALDVGSGHFPPPLFGEIAAEVPPMEGPPAGAGPIDVGDGLFTYRQLLSLPAAPAMALGRIEQAETALRHRYAETLLRWHSPGAEVTARGDLAPIPKLARSFDELLLISHLIASPVPSRVRLALFHAAAAVPGVSVAHVRDQLGRSGVLVSAIRRYWQPVRFIFDPATGELLDGLPADGGPPDVPGKFSTVVAQGPVASITALPNSFRWIRGVSTPPLWPSPSMPRMIAVSPSAGGPRTAFTLMLAATRGERPHPAPTGWLGITGSAGRGIYRGGNSGFDPCLPRASVKVWPARTNRAGGKLIYVYRVSPQRFHLHAWCAGRYQLGMQVFPNPIPPHYTTPPYTGHSGTTIYFQVR